MDPEQTDLLSVARAVLRNELIEDIPAHKKYHALMVANAMAISEREHRLGPLNKMPEDIIHALGEFTQNEENSGAVGQGVISALRSGPLDGGSPAIKALHELLVKDVKRKLAICNPGYLSQK